MLALPPTRIPPDISRVAAPLLFGSVWNWCLFGVLLVQIYVYSYNFPEDKKFLKLFVYGVFFLETLQTALSGADLYYWFVSGYGNLRHLTNPYANPFDVPVIEALVSLSVQFFFAYRIWVLSSKKFWWYCLIICLCSTIDATAAFIGGIYTFMGGKFPSGKGLVSVSMVWLIGNTMADILIAAAMLYHLVRRRRDRDCLGSSHILDHALPRIVGLTVETNLMTTSVGIISLLIVMIFPQENWYTCPMAILGKLYSNTLLVSLNNRISIREATATEKTSIKTSVVTFAVTPFSEDGVDTIAMKLPTAHRTMSLADEGHERVAVHQ